MWNNFDCFTTDNVALKSSSLNCKITRTENKDLFYKKHLRNSSVPGADARRLKEDGATNLGECQLFIWSISPKTPRLGEGSTNGFLCQKKMAEPQK